MPDARDEDLFAGSTMSFGEHLEELRGALLRALLGLAIGFAIGLYFGKEVVEIIKFPLEKSLKRYYQDESVLRYEKFAEKQQADGRPLPYSIEQIKDLVNNQHLVFTMYQVHPSAVRKTLEIEPGRKGTDKIAGVATGAETSPAAQGSQAADAAPQAQLEPLTPLFVWRPVTDDDRATIKSLSATETFMLYLKAALMAGAIIASPWIFYQLWVFVGAGLYPKEKRFVHVFLPFSLLLFLAGAAFCFFVVFPYVLDYLFSFNRMLGIAPDPRISEWLGFALFLPVGFGVSFQMPLVMLFLNRIGIFSIQTYVSKWRIAVLVIFFISMLITPGGDPISMLSMAVPMTLLYFSGILLCHWAGPKKNPLQK